MTSDIKNFSPFVQKAVREGRISAMLLPLLQRYLDEHGFISIDHLNEIQMQTGIPAADIEEVSSFYSCFRRKPAGKHSIKVCIGTACHVKGAENVYEAFRRELKIKGNEDTDPRLLFTVEKVACLGCCMIAPAVQIDNVIYGNLTPAKVSNVVKDFLEKKNHDLSFHKCADIPTDGQVKTCLCSSCSAAGALKVFNEILTQREKFGFKFSISRCSCTGRSYEAPLLEIVSCDGISETYPNVSVNDISKILSKHFRPEGILKRLSFAAKIFSEKTLLGDESNIFSKAYPGKRDWNLEYNALATEEFRIATENAGKSDPLDIDAYIESGGFKAYYNALQAGPENIIKTVLDSGLRGRGGAGYPTGLKWKSVAESKESQKYLVCNGDEGDPGAFMDRMILESFPFRVIEGMLVAGIAVGARECIIYVRAEYPLAVETISSAIKIAISRKIFSAEHEDARRRFEFSVVRGAGAFVCGEETALVASIEGRRGTPSLRPPYPSQKGIFGRPTLINNVETFANIPWIINNGAGAFKKIGRGKSFGTKTFALAGKIAKGGLIEVPLGTTISDIASIIGGGTPNGKKIKAVQVGGPSGVCIPFDKCGTSLDYEILEQTGAIMGSGGIIILDEDDCMVDIARYFLEFTAVESCGKCAFCRVGTHRMLEIMRNLCEGKASANDIQRLETLAKQVSKASLCGLGKTAPNPVLSTLQYFREEYLSHASGKCPAKKCKELIQYQIDESCIGCGICARKCCAKAIKSTPYKQHEIDQLKCEKCGNCLESCPIDAVKITDANNIPTPYSIC